MRTEEEKEDSKKLGQILIGVQEIQAVVQELKTFRKFVVWAFAIVTIAVAFYDFWKDFLGGVLK